MPRTATRAARTSAKKRPRPAPVVAVKPHPLVWKEALRLARGDVARLVVHSPESITVLNPR